MKARALSIAGLALLLASTVAAQTKITAQQQCDKGEVVGTGLAGDHPGHAMSLVKGSCAWGTPMEMEGGKSKTGTSLAFVDANPARITTNGTYVGVMENGDKFFVSFHDSSPAKDGKPVGVKGTWMYTGGTGKLAGIKGKGTYTSKLNDDGTSVVDVEGEYTIGAPAKTKVAAPKGN
jgi:hypothetical protein